MISTGITGTARHGTSPNSASWMRVKTLQCAGAATLQDRGAGARHMRRLRRVADRLQREIRLDRGGEIERAAMEQRPAAMRALDRTQIARQRLLQPVIDLVEIVLQQNIFGRDGGIRLELEHPMPVRTLPLEQRRRGAVDSRRQRRLLLWRGIACDRERLSHGRLALPRVWKNRVTMVWHKPALKPFSFCRWRHSTPPATPAITPFIYALRY